MFAIFPEILNQTAAGDIEAVTCLVRKYFGDGQVFAPNLRVSELCANAEIKIKTEARNYAARLEAWDANGQFRIEISLHPEIKNIRELNYILATMLGHIFLDLQPKMAKGELQRSSFEKKQSPLRELLFHPESATSIDHFASSLILPKAMVRKAMAALSSKIDVAGFFNVDLALLDYRLEQLGLLVGGRSEKEKAPRAKAEEPAQTHKKMTKADHPSAKSVEPRAPLKNSSHERSPLSPSSTLSAGERKPAAKDQVEKEKASPPPLPLPSKSEDLSSLARVKRSTAARSYRKEDENRSEAKPSKPAPESTEKSGSGLARIRELARKIDKSVSD